MRPHMRVNRGTSRGLTRVDAFDANVVRFTRGRVSVVRPTTGPSKVRGIYESTRVPSRKTPPGKELGVDFNPGGFPLPGQNVAPDRAPGPLRSCEGACFVGKWGLSV